MNKVKRDRKMDYWDSKKILQRKERLIKEKRKEKENIDYGERKDRLQRKEKQRKARKITCIFSFHLTLKNKDLATH